LKKKERKINICYFETKIEGNKHCWEKEKKKMYVTKMKGKKGKNREKER